MLTTYRKSTNAKRLGRAVTLAAAGAVLMAGTAFSTSQASASDVALLLPENVNPRWESQDAAAFVATMKEIAPDISVEVYNANNDTAAQQRQAEQALTKGAKVLVVIPIDGESSAVIADAAAEAGVPTIAYDRMINSKNTTFWVQADLEGMGYDQAMHVIENTKDGDTLVMLKGSPTDPNAAVIHNGQLRALTPLYDSGKRIMGYENWTQGWDPAIARRSMDQALTKLNNNVQGVVSSNDGNAGAAIASMEEQGMAGKVPVSGLDCTVAAQQLMLLGKQTQCGWRPLADMAATTAKVTAKIVAGEDWKSLAPDTVKNGVGADVNFVSVASYSAVGEEGVAYVIENDPSISKDDVCKGPAAETAFCKK
ncbi:MAG: substrate-binding domain-containing protein [Alphaproteobacteria bacterium]|nr:substrate-binding domain-containing protein [Alphaproteobacteria bacterium]